MQLERIEIAGFRGIKRLSLSINALTTLLGENTWGKSSLLDALSLALPVEGELPQFSIRDFHLDYAQSQPQSQQLHIVLVFGSTDKQQERAVRYRKLAPLWVVHQHKKKIFYCLRAHRQGQQVTTEVDFLCAQGLPLPLTNKQALAKELMSLHPILRLKQSQQAFAGNPSQSSPALVRLEKRINNTCRRLLSTPGHVNKGEIRSSLSAMHSLIGHYFSFKASASSRSQDGLKDNLFYAASSTEPSLQRWISGQQDKQTQLLLMRLLNAYLQAKGKVKLRQCARPILIIEDPEGHLHPTQLARAWSLIQRLPVQKVLTTNSSDIVSWVPLGSIRRLVRKSDKTQSYHLNPEEFSQDELRKIGFHIRYHRTGALFARCWLLVEGETEVWLFNQFAQICHYNLAAEGVQIIEFAQSGLKSLIKVAQTLGIDWHVVTDGDMAGKKYAHSVRSRLLHEPERHHLSELPDLDIEHFLFHHGFEPFFKSLLRIPLDHPIPAKKVVNRALKKYAKPDLALAIVDYCEQYGTERIPLLIRWILKRVVTSARGRQ
ncbi:MULTISPECIES: DUF2813 domain-containing protein [unclassified Vibrio]|uniref:DUF2813 domain-containing protein n=1 Tax=Vibrio sp. HB236076 TaxID=3232307 RepID=A0AB39HKC6_9VIBR|nr:DUF2813 domain-containing protein [Vibrio sp. HB161653]MDP5253001.1 DUF2813 domain-containing protein [Vibrio sp. HB161653]